MRSAFGRPSARSQFLVVALLCAGIPSLARAQGGNRNLLPDELYHRRDRSIEKLDEAGARFKEATAALEKLPRVAPSLRRVLRERFDKLAAVVARYDEQHRRFESLLQILLKDVNATNRNPNKSEAEFKALSARARKITEDWIVARERAAATINPLAIQFVADVERALEADEKVKGFLAQGKLGYDDTAPKKLTDTARALADKNRAKYEKDENGTKCNFFVRDFARGFVGFDVPELVEVTANDMYDNLKASANWQSLDMQKDVGTALQKAQEAANGGKLVVVGYKDPSGHGHVAVVVPSDVGLKDSKNNWGMPLPYIAQAGVEVFAADKLNRGFGPQRMPGMEVFVLAPRPEQP